MIGDDLYSLHVEVTAPIATCKMTIEFQILAGRFTVTRDNVFDRATCNAMPLPDENARVKHPSSLRHLGFLDFLKICRIP